MILAEPPPSQGDLHFSLLGFPVRIHPYFWLVGLMLGFALRDPVLVVMWVVAMLLCILLHELGHAVVMQAYGFRPSIVLYSFGGLAIPHGRYGVRRPGPLGRHADCLRRPGFGLYFGGSSGPGIALSRRLSGHDLRVVVCDVVPDVFVPNHLFGRVPVFRSSDLRDVGPGESLADLSAGRRPNRPADLRLEQSAAMRYASR